MPRRAASLRPTEDLPAPIMPTSTIERRPSAAAMAASAGAAGPVFCRARSDMAFFRKRAQWPHISFLVQAGGASCHGGENMIVVNGAAGIGIRPDAGPPVPPYILLMRLVFRPWLAPNRGVQGGPPGRTGVRCRV